MIRKMREIGWREWVALPAFDLPQVKAKIDTGARTSAIHASDIAVKTVNGKTWVAFTILDLEDDDEKRVEAEILDRRAIKNTSGIEEERIIVKTILQIGDVETEIELSLADRDNMTFPLIIGRTAIRSQKMLVNPARSFLNARSLRVSRKKAD